MPVPQLNAMFETKPRNRLLFHMRSWQRSEILCANSVGVAVDGRQRSRVTALAPKQGTQVEVLTPIMKAALIIDTCSITADLPACTSRICSQLRRQTDVR